MNLHALTTSLQRHASHSVWMLDPGDEVRRISFGEIHARVEAAIRALSARGVTAGMRVGILAENCIEWLIYDLAMLALRTTSVAFPRELAAESWPELFERYDLSLMLVASGEELPLAALGGPTHFIDAAAQPAEPARPPRRPHAPGAATPALTFSSGSTGKSKCMIVNPAGLWFDIDYLRKLYDLRHEDRLYVFLPLSHYQQRGCAYAAFELGMDLALVRPQQIFAGFQRLAPTLCIAPPLLYETIYAQFHNRVDKLPAPARWGYRKLAAAMRRLPAGAPRRALERLVYGPIHKALGGAMRVMATGMAPIKRDVLEFFAGVGIPVYEGYGTGETGLLAANAGGKNRIGAVGTLSADGAVTLADDGEIIARQRPFSAHGYLHAEPGGERAELFDAGQFATGDIGRFDEDGFLYLVGRKKEIIITSNGLKIHPETVEAKLAHHHLVERVCVLGVDAPYLAAVIVPRVQSDAAVEAAIHEHVGAVNAALNLGTQVGRVIFSPESFKHENGLLTRTLKLDRRGIARRFAAELGAPAAGAAAGPGARDGAGAGGAAPYAAPRTDGERALTAIWAELLGVERVGIHDEFLALGGNSLLALQVAARAQREGLRLEARQLFEHPTIAALAQALAAAPAPGADPDASEAADPDDAGDLPLAPNLAWFAETFDVEHQVWAMTVLWQAPPGLALDRAVLAAAARHLLAHHDVLRLRMRHGPDGWALRLDPAAEVLVEEHDLGALSPDGRARAIVERATALQTRLSIVAGPTLALAVCRLGDTPDKLVISLHHAAYDAYSLGLLMEDFLAAYARLAGGQAPALPPVPTPYRGYLRALAEHARSPAMAEARAFWLAPARLRPVPALPVDLPGGRHTDRNSRRHTQVLARALLDGVRAWLAAHPEAHLNEVLVFGLARAYARWTGADALRLDIEHNGRTVTLPGVDLVRTVGPTTLKVPAMIELRDPPDDPPDAPPAQAFGRIQRALRETMAHALGFGLLRYGGDGAAREQLRALGAPRLFFNNRGLTTGRAPAALGAFEPLVLPRADGGESVVSYDLMIECDNTPAGPAVTWVYSAALHRPETIAALADGMVEQIRGLVQAP